jgi:apolipoprotein N-acyltransferase
MTRNPADATPGSWLLPILSGIFIGTSYIPFPPWASLFGFVPLWIFWQRQPSISRIVLGGMLTAFVFTLIGFNWVTYLLHEFAHLDWPLAVLGMIAFALLAHLFVPLAGLLWFLGQRRFQWPEPVSLALMAMITTLSQAHTPTLFDWNFGYSWYGAGLPVFHWAEMIGFSGLSAATVLGNLPMYYAWKYRNTGRGRRILIAVVLSFAALNGGGLWLKWRLPEPDASLTALLVQGNIGNAEKLSAELGNAYQDEILTRYLKLTDKGVAASPAPIDFAIWPETAYPSFLGADLRSDPHGARLKQYLSDRRLALITGAYGFDRSSRMMTNSLFVLDRKGETIGPHYSKSILLAFGEYIPGESLVPWIRDWLPPTGQFARGNGPTTLLQLDGYRIGPQICYESLFPAFTRSLAELGAQFIVNATNDSWYGSWQEPHQHLYMTLARGVEFRRPVLRATNTGISTVSLASGDLLERSPIHQDWAGVYRVPYRKSPPATVYQTGFYVVPVLLWVSLIGLLTLGRGGPTRKP